jgi:hypothetical protein
MRYTPGSNRSRRTDARLQNLPGFNNEAVIESMTCVENKRFVCWQKDDA